MISESYNISEFVNALEGKSLAEISFIAGEEIDIAREESFKDRKADTYYRFLGALRFLCGMASLPASGLSYTNLKKVEPIILKAVEGTAKEAEFKKLFGVEE